MMITFFISSTFRDMQSERDIIQNKILPRIRKDMKAYGQEIGILDYRWGIDTTDMSEEESSTQVLKICIDGLDRCKPYMIILLGERYGWIPNEMDIQNTYDQRIEKIYQNGMSVTNMEIEYGALAGDINRCIFCLRDSNLLESIGAEDIQDYQAETDLHKEKMAQVKQTILECAPHVINYCAGWDSENHCVSELDDFADRLYTLIKELISQEFADVKPLDEMGMIEQYHDFNGIKSIKNTIPFENDLWLFEEEVLRNMAYLQYTMGISRILKHCRCEDGEFRDLGKAVGSNKRIFAITGEEGVGKTTFLLQCARKAEEKCPIILLSGKLDAFQDYQTILKYLVAQLDKKASGFIQDIPNEEKAVEPEARLKQLDLQMGSYDQGFDKQTVCLFIDDWHLLPKESIKLFSILKNVKFIITVPAEYHLPENDFQYNYYYYRLELYGMDETEKEKMIHQIASSRGKQMGQQAIEFLCEKHISRYPSAMRLMLHRLFNMSQEDFQKAERIGKGIVGINAHMINLIKEMPDSLNLLMKYFIDHVFERFSFTNIQKVLTYLALSLDGLTDQELHDLLFMEGITVDRLLFEEFLSYMYLIIQQNQNGKWQLLNQSYAKRILEQSNCEPVCKEMLCNYALENEDFLVREGYWYLLENKHAKAGVIFHLEAIAPTKLNYALKQLLDKDDSYEAYIVSLFHGEMSDHCVQFWLSKWVENSKKDSDVQQKVLATIYAACEVSPFSKLELLDRLGPQKEETIEQYLLKFETLLKKLDGKSLAIKQGAYEWYKFHYAKDRNSKQELETWNRCSQFLKDYLDDHPEDSEVLYIWINTRIHYLEMVQNVEKKYLYDQYEALLEALEMVKKDYPKKAIEYECRIRKNLVLGYTYGERNHDNAEWTNNQNRCLALITILLNRYASRETILYVASPALFDLAKTVRKGRQNRYLELETTLMRSLPMDQPVEYRYLGDSLGCLVADRMIFYKEIIKEGNSGKKFQYTNAAGMAYTVRADADVISSELKNRVLPVYEEALACYEYYFREESTKEALEAYISLETDYAMALELYKNYVTAEDNTLAIDEKRNQLCFHALKYYESNGLTRVSSAQKLLYLSADLLYKEADYKMAYAMAERAVKAGTELVAKYNNADYRYFLYQSKYILMCCAFELRNDLLAYNLSIELLDQYDSIKNHINWRNDIAQWDCHYILMIKTYLEIPSKGIDIECMTRLYQFAQTSIPKLDNSIFLLIHNLYELEKDYEQMPIKYMYRLSSRISSFGIGSRYAEDILHIMRETILKIVPDRNELLGNYFMYYLIQDNWEEIEKDRWCLEEILKKDEEPRLQFHYEQFFTQHPLGVLYEHYPDLPWTPQHLNWIADRNVWNGRFEEARKFYALADGKKEQAEVLSRVELIRYLYERYEDKNSTFILVVKAYLDFMDEPTMEHLLAFMEKGYFALYDPRNWTLFYDVYQTAISLDLKDEAYGVQLLELLKSEKTLTYLTMYAHKIVPAKSRLFYENSLKYDADYFSKIYSAQFAYEVHLFVMKQLGVHCYDAMKDVISGIIHDYTDERLLGMSTSELQQLLDFCMKTDEFTKHQHDTVQQLMVNISTVLQKRNARVIQEEYLERIMEALDAGRYDFERNPEALSSEFLEQRKKHDKHNYLWLKMLDILYEMNPDFAKERLQEFVEQPQKRSNSFLEIKKLQQTMSTWGRG